MRHAAIRYIPAACILLLLRTAPLLAGLDDELPPPAKPAPAAAEAPAPKPDEPAPSPEAAPPSGEAAPVPAGAKQSAPSAVSRVRTPSGIRLKHGTSLDRKRESIAVERWIEKGQWKEQTFVVGKGERIGQVKQRLDFTTRWRLVDITEVTRTEKRTIMKPVFNPKTGEKLGEEVDRVEEISIKERVLTLGYLDAVGNPAAGKDGNPIEVKVRSGKDHPFNLPEIAEEDVVSLPSPDPSSP